MALPTVPKGHNHTGVGKSHLAALVVGRLLVSGKRVLLELVPATKAREARRESWFYLLELKAGKLLTVAVAYCCCLLLLLPACMSLCC